MKIYFRGEEIPPEQHKDYVTAMAKQEIAQEESKIALSVYFKDLQNDTIKYVGDDGARGMAIIAATLTKFTSEYAKRRLYDNKGDMLQGYDDEVAKMFTRLKLNKGDITFVDSFVGVWIEKYFDPQTGQCLFDKLQMQ